MKKERRSFLLLLICLLSVLYLAGCASQAKLLPSNEKFSGRVFTSYEDYEKRFDSVEIGDSLEDCASKEIDPRAIPNTTEMYYFDIVQLLSSGLKVRDPEKLPDLAKKCLKAGPGCVGYYIYDDNIIQKREGRLIDDWTQRKRIKRTTGWIFSGYIVFIDNRVVGVLKGGKRNIDVTEIKKKPLTFLYDAFDIRIDYSIDLNNIVDDLLNF